MTSIPRTYSNWNAVHRMQDAVIGIPLLPSGAVAIALTIARHINEKGTAYASYTTFLEEAHVPHSTCTRAISALVAAGLIIKLSGGRPNRSNEFRLGENVPEFEVAAEKTERSFSSKKAPAPTQRPQTAERAASFNKLLNYV
jgi:hypothetical protein